MYTRNHSNQLIEIELKGRLSVKVLNLIRTVYLNLNDNHYYVKYNSDYVKVLKVSNGNEIWWRGSLAQCQ